METITKWAAGEMHCAACNQPLPAVHTWPGHLKYYCDRVECQLAAKNHPTRRYISEGEVKCQTRGCDNFIPAGSYDKRYTQFTCSSECWRRWRVQKAMGNTLMTCACGCGEQFYSGKADRENYFVNLEHSGRYRTEQTLVRCGKFLPLIKEYLDGFGRIHYAKASLGSALTSLVAFCEFLIERGIDSMNDVMPKIITDYLRWGLDTERNQVAHSVSAISTFFNWQIGEGKRTLANPVVPFMHHMRRNELEPRPFSSEELESVWSILDKRGNARLKLAMAIGEESGLRISEITNIRLEDVDSTKQKIYVRIPTKNKKPRTVPFGPLTKQYLDEWLKERDPDCGHNHLFHGKMKKASNAQQLRNEFKAVLTKQGNTSYGGRRTNPDGLDSFSPHRLRHTMSSSLASGGANVSTVMKIGGWNTYKAMCGYTKIDEDVAMDGYGVAMKRSKEIRAEKKTVRKVNLADLAKQRKASGK